MIGRDFLDALCLVAIVAFLLWVMVQNIRGKNP